MQGLAVRPGPMLFADHIGPLAVRQDVARCSPQWLPDTMIPLAAVPSPTTWGKLDGPVKGLRIGFPREYSPTAFPPVCARVEAGLRILGNWVRDRRYYSP